MYFESKLASTEYAKSQEFSLGSRHVAAYCMMHGFPLAEHKAFNKLCDEVLSFGPTFCGLKNHRKFSVRGRWTGGTSRIVHTRYPPPPSGEQLDTLLAHPNLIRYVEHFEDYLRSRKFATAYGDPLFHDTLTIYQDGETCYIAACLNFVLHVPELRSMFFKAFRLKAVALDQLTESHFPFSVGSGGAARRPDTVAGAGHQWMEPPQRRPTPIRDDQVPHAGHDAAHRRVQGHIGEGAQDAK